VDVLLVGSHSGLFCDVCDDGRIFSGKGEIRMDGIKNIGELQEKLDGVYDLEQLEDCRKMIDVLLRSICEKEIVALRSQDQLHILALMVVNRNSEARDKALEVLSGSRKSRVKVIDFLTSMADTMKLSEAMTNEQLVTEVTDKIWMGLDMSSRESAVLGEMIFRIKKLQDCPDSQAPSVMYGSEVENVGCCKIDAH
jgi:hypothetical protein